MRLPTERSLALRSAIVAVSCLAVVGLVQSAAAGDLLGLRGLPFLPADLFGAAEAPAPAAAPLETVQPHRSARRIWASSRARPLRIRLDRQRRRVRDAGRRGASRRGTGMAAAQAWRASPRLSVLPKPERPSIVEITQDRTLRNGDAVMMADGIRLFRGGTTWPHQGSDFVRLRFAVNLGWALRHTLTDIDSAPPTRWSGLASTAG